MALCNQSTINKDEYRETMSEVYDHWVSKKGIVDRFTYRRSGYNVKSSIDNMKWFIEQRMELPWDSDFVMTDSQIRKIKVEIDSFDKALGGKFSNLVWMVPEGISKQDPVSRRFYTNLNNILNRTRVNTGRKENTMAEVTSHFLDAYVNAGLNRKYFKVGVDAVNELRNLRQQAMEAPTADIKNKFENLPQNKHIGKTKIIRF